MMRFLLGPDDLLGRHQGVCLAGILMLAPLADFIRGTV